MSRNKKIVLFVVLPVLALCVLSCVALVVVVPMIGSRLFATDAGSAKRVGAQIADYTLPSGYQEVMGMDLFTTQLVAIGKNGRDNTLDTMIMLMQFRASNVNRAQMEQQMQQAFSGQFQRNGSNMTSVGDRTVTIKGKPVTLTLSEGTSDGGKFRQATGVFDGKGGLAMVMIMGPTSDWDWTSLDSFFQSIR
jgi:hypothetical protein